jgi:PAS domain S-box-containing protein
LVLNGATSLPPGFDIERARPMPETIARRNRVARPSRWTSALLISLAWLVVVALAIRKLRQEDRWVVACSGFVAAAITFGIVAWAERARWRNPIQHLTRLVRASRRRPKLDLFAASLPEFAELANEIEGLAKLVRPQSATRQPGLPPSFTSSEEPEPSSWDSAFLTQSGLFDAPPLDQSRRVDPNVSGEYSTVDMVNRLDPVGFHWIESSPAEQIFLGWTITELRGKSFLDILHPGDRRRTEETLREALARGEALGLVVRVHTAMGKTRAIEVNVGARYASNQKVSHLRCHLSDVTEKVRAEREVRLRSVELTQVNEQLRRINRELEELKNRYSDLYENAPAMYFSIDVEGRVFECNQTLLSTLNRARDQIVGLPYQNLLPESLWPRFQVRFQEFLQSGSAQNETRWVKSNGEIIDVWVVSTVVQNPKDLTIHARCVAQDVTTKRRLEAELQEKNRHLARANDELSQTNRELDEFVYVVSHDLQEPLRTLIAFSDFLLKDYGDRLDDAGQEYVRYLVDASRRMRAMILGLLNLSRAGKVIGDFAEVDLEELVADVKADLGERFRAKGGELRIVGPLPRLWGDRDRIGQLLVNLIGNGIKYNESPNPWVEIGAVHSAGADLPGGARDGSPGDEAIIYVKDNGIGVEPQFHATIFQLFRRLHTQDQYEGTGVGLAICGKIVQAHGGRIWVESAPGQGATFYIQLRRGAPAEGQGPSQSS